MASIAKETSEGKQTPDAMSPKSQQENVNEVETQTDIGMDYFDKEP